MRARNSANSLAINLPFLSQLLQMFVIQPIGNAYIALVPTFITRLVSADE